VGTNPSARGTVRALGLHRIGESVVLADDVATRGQVRAVRYLLDVEELAPAADAPASAKSGSGRNAAPAKRTSTTSKPAAAPARRAVSTASKTASKKEAQS
jgi:large subunit ribosomal protein L30